jgi:hypothetical protein
VVCRVPRSTEGDPSRPAGRIDDRAPRRQDGCRVMRSCLASGDDVGATRTGSWQLRRRWAAAGLWSSRRRQHWCGFRSGGCGRVPAVCCLLGVGLGAPDACLGDVGTPWLDQCFEDRRAVHAACPEGDEVPATNDHPDQIVALASVAAHDQHLLAAVAPLRRQYPDLRARREMPRTAGAVCALVTRRGAGHVCHNAPAKQFTAVHNSHHQLPDRDVHRISVRRRGGHRAGDATTLDGRMSSGAS